MATKKAAKKTVSIMVGRLDNYKVVKVSSKLTVAQAFEKHDYVQADGETYQDRNGNVLEGDELVKQDAGYLLVQSVKSR